MNQQDGGQSIKSINSETPSSYKTSARTSDEYIDTFIIIPPDGGWGWVVVFCSFVCNFVADGAVYTFGLFLNDMSQTFKTTPTNVAVANSINTGFYYISGPLSCALVNRLGFQITGFIGGMTAAVAFICSSFLTTLTPFLIIYGFVGGLAFGLIYVPSVVAVGFYFERWRALATSIAVTGSAAGIMGFPIIIERILFGLSWQTKYQVIGGICAFTGVLCFIYRPIKPTRVLTNKDNKVLHIFSKESNNELLASEEAIKRKGLLKNIYNKFHHSKIPTHSQLYKDSTVLMYFPPGPSTSSIFVNSINEDSFSNVLNYSPSKTGEGRSEKFDKLSTVFENEDKGKTNCCQKFCCCSKDCRKVFHPKHQNRPLYRDDIFYHGSLFTLSEFKPSKISATKSIDYALSVTRVELPDEKHEDKHFLCCHASMIRILVTMLNFQLLNSLAFVLLAMSGFFTILGMYGVFIYLIERSSEIKISPDESYYFFTALGAFNFLGRILSGIISTIPQAKPEIVTCTSLLICGISVIVSCFLVDIYSQFTFCAVFGLTISSFATLRTPIVVTLVGLENLTNAFGLLLLFNGIAAFLGVPVAGKIVKVTQSYNGAFIFSGICIFISGMLLVPIRQVARKEKERRKV